MGQILPLIRFRAMIKALSAADIFPGAACVRRRTHPLRLRPGLEPALAGGRRRPTANGKYFDELYAYDGLDRLSDMRRGTLNAQNGITNKSVAQDCLMQPTTGPIPKVTIMRTEHGILISAGRPIQFINSPALRKRSE